MTVKEVNEKYRCNICGNEIMVTKVGGGTLVCCGEEMELIEPKEKKESILEEGVEVGSAEEEQIEKETRFEEPQKEEKPEDEIAKKIEKVAEELGEMEEELEDKEEPKEIEDYKEDIEAMEGEEE